MRTSPLLFATAAATLIATAACSSKAPDAGASDAAMAGSTDMPAEESGGVGPEAMAAAPSAQGFVDQASASDLFEVESSKLAATSAKSDAVKAFAKMMIEAHTKSTAALKAAVADTKGVTAAPKLTGAQQADLDALKAAGDGFDTMYAAKQVAGHEAALALLQSYSAGGAAGPLKDFAGKTAPVVQTHLAEARKLP